MKQGYGQLNDQVEIFQQILIKGPARIQKIYALPNFIVLEIYGRFAGDLYLYIGTGKAFQCLFNSPKKPPVNFRIQSKFKSLLTKYFSGQILEDIQLSKQDRIFTISTSGKVRARFSFYWSHANLYFVYGYSNLNKVEMRCSWRNEKWIIAEDDWDAKIHEAFGGIGDLVKIDGVKQDHYSYEQLVHNYYFQKGPNKKKREMLKDLRGKHERMSKNLVALQKWQFVKRALSDRSIQSVHDVINNYGIKIKVNERDSVEKIRSCIFDKIKGSQKKFLHVEHLKNELEKQILEVEQWPDDIVAVPQAVHPIWNEKGGDDSKQLTESNTKAAQYRTFVLKDGATIVIGKNDTGNDYLRNKWANKTDQWVHLYQKPSAHVWIRAKDNNQSIPITSKAFQLAAFLLAGELNNQEVDLMYTRKDSLKAKKGKVGAVSTANYKVVRLITDKSILEFIAQVF